MHLFGHQIRDFLPLTRESYKPSPQWMNKLREREEKQSRSKESLRLKWSEHTRHQKQLKVGDLVSIQNLLGNKPLRWERTGQVVEVRQFDQYGVKVDGTGRVTYRNRKHLRLIGHQSVQEKPRSSQSRAPLEHIPAPITRVPPPTPSSPPKTTGTPPIFRTESRAIPSMPATTTVTTPTPLTGSPPTPRLPETPLRGSVTSAPRRALMESPAQPRSDQQVIPEKTKISNKLKMLLPHNAKGKEEDPKHESRRASSTRPT